MLHGTLMLGGADYAPLNLYGVGVFMAFSGNGVYRNQGACGGVKGDGPLPPGKYWVVERGSGGLVSWGKAKAQDTWNMLRWGAEYGRDEWFALYRDDWGIDDGTWVNDVHRGLFRLHPGHISEGCITIPHNSDFGLIRDAFLKEKPEPVPCMRSLMARGYIEVVVNGIPKTCPSNN